MIKQVETNKQRILGIDPGFGRMGWGVIEKVGDDWRSVDYGCIETSSSKKFVERLVELNQELKKLIKKFQPTRSAIEDLFFAQNAKTAMQVGEARGVIILTLVEAGLPVDEFTPLQVKQAITGYGRAEKGQVERMLQIFLGLKKCITPDDAADALAVALTSGASLSLKKRVSDCSC